jgi:SAM-dependent methyltransferase
MQILKPHRTCRVCGAPLIRVIDLGEQYLQGMFPDSESSSLFTDKKFPTALAACDMCGLLQMENTVNPSVLYSRYAYQSGTNATMRDHLKAIVDQAMTIYPNQRGTVLDIGCNDGTLLSHYPRSFTKIGVDPSNVAMREHARSLDAALEFKIIGEMFPSMELVTCLNGRKLAIVTAIAMFYDLEDPVECVRAVRELLEPEGIFVIEVSHMPTMLKNNSYDTICAEHLEYYAFTDLEYILNRGGLRPFMASLTEANGGSIRVYACREECRAYHTQTRSEHMRKLAVSEAGPDYEGFMQRIEGCKKDLMDLLIHLRAQGKIIHVYGASTKGNTILQWCRINYNLVEYAADRNPNKHGCTMLGSGIKIISEEESRAMNPDYYLVLPWHFEKEFKEREKIMLQKGTKMIFPLPEVRLVGV